MMGWIIIERTACLVHAAGMYAQSFLQVCMCMHFSNALSSSTACMHCQYYVHVLLVWADELMASVSIMPACRAMYIIGGWRIHHDAVADI